MTSEPKLPFAGESTRVGELKPPAATTLPCLPEHASGVAVESDANVEVATPLSRARLWLRRIGVLLFVFLCATLGMMLMIVPWRPGWSDNPLLFPYPALREIVASGFVRGIATGLGALNVWIGFWEAIQYQEEE